MRRILSVIVSLIMIFIMLSCEDKEEFKSEINEFGSYIQGEKSVCFIPRKYMNKVDGVDEILLRFFSNEKHTEYEIVARIKPSGINYLLEIPMNDIRQMNDGAYIMTCFSIDGKLRKSKLEVEIRKHMLHCIFNVMAEYTLAEGNGTLDDPYIISSAEDFDLFKYILSTDEFRGKGQYFKQTASFKANAPSYGNTNRGYGCEDFAGNYDGGNYTIEYDYIGSSDNEIDKNIGLFSELLDGAKICNLNIDGSIGNVNKNAGALAGSASGSVEVDRVFYKIRIYSNSTSNECVGGLIGRVENSVIKIKSSGNKGYDFISLGGSRYVGGLIGCLSNSRFEIKDVEINHDVSDESLAPIYASDSYVGGVIGAVLSVNGNVQFEDCEVKTSIRAVQDYIGGVVGYAKIEDSNCSLKIVDCTIGSYIRGGRYVGGFSGALEGGGSCEFARTSTVKNKNIYGKEYVGGFVGKATDIYVNFYENIRLLLGENGIVAGDKIAGGLFGELAGNTVRLQMDMLDIEFNDALTVSAGWCVGGLVGFMNDVIFQTTSNVSLSGSIPKSDSFKPCFEGTVQGGNRVGGAVGHSIKSSIKGVNVRATVNGVDSVGGIVGSAELTTTDCKISDCTFGGQVNASSGKDVGGICGKFNKDGMLYYCINYGTIVGRENVGGIAGAANYSDISQTRTFFNYCVNVGAVTGSTDVGGVVGYMHGDDDYYIQVLSCANYGKITGSSSTTGGVVGLIPTTKGRVYYCANHGEVYSSNSCRTGGIIGSMGKDPGGLYQSTNLEIGWCANKGKVSSSGESRVGGIVGYAEEGAVDWKDQDSFVHDCYNMGTVTTDGNSSGGIIGYSDRYCYLKCLVNYGSADYAIAGAYKYGPDCYDDYTYYTNGDEQNYINDKSLSNPGEQSSYEGFDFNYIWKIDNDKAILQTSYCPFQNVDYAE